MQQYIGQKRIKARPATFGEFHKSTPAPVTNTTSPDAPGYHVIYEDSYESWSPKDVFEKAYRPVDGGLSFGEALEALKRGYRIARKGWNGKGMFLFLLPASDGIPTSYIKDPALRAVIESETGGDTFDALGSIRMFTADRKILTGWLASQTDLLSEDWVVL